jgi:hypothetical protein
LRRITLQSEVTKARAADEARLNEGWALLHQATERCRLLDQRAAERREQVRKEAEEICNIPIFGKRIYKICT